ncbi:4-hydroxythreonine-4-phosphate dehydrogenase [Puniceicoccales bacterium CK1056]|uniref:4-hydroxythreonine-4-phosphate dehydrogenase n=1 Tax=Oceanipulchritudo coccoides TaxID=2706888 RepID=A0A6B2M1F8_9BACT|nr:4-hydroxythreonine-4-phosphate dehydrogenase PdxA [Oceanipulchritudo coccoides]NDV62182.1 4-hydroxythreonine-4-phosphate dehydrogenase [Oceanipulchritudo coccoides]
MSARPPIALTCGDPSGIGPEIIAKWLSENPDWAPLVCPVGPEAWLESLGIPGLQTPGKKGLFAPGTPTREGAKVAWDALQLAATGCLEGRFSAVVTGPVGKEQLQAIGYPFPGQTEFFADAWGGVPSMAFAGKELKVVLATWHESLASIPGRLKKEPDLLDRAVIHAVEWAQREGIKEPRIAVCGLNPHAGEGGMLGLEERDLLNPRLEIMRRLYPGVTACLPADTVFHRMREQEFDVAVALYHDQGLIPVKTLEFHTAVNVTLGLKFVRTSPDHGTAFAIAGKGIARTGSFAHAVELAARYAQVRS